MHEYSIVQSLLDRVESEAAAHGATAVHRLWLKIGEMSGVETSLLRSAYETFTERSICARAAWMRLSASFRAVSFDPSMIAFARTSPTPGRS